jgi:hypothetical protein
MTIRTVLVAFDVDSHAHPNADNPDVDLTVAQRAVASDEDIAEGVRARLAEFYPTDDGFPFEPDRVRVAVTTPPAFAALVAAAGVGLDGADEDSTGLAADVLDEAALAVESLEGDRLEPIEEGRHISIRVQRVYTVVDAEGRDLFTTADPEVANRAVGWWKP